MAWERLQEVEGIDVQRMGIIGLSMGGFVAALLTGQDGVHPKSVALLSAVNNLPEIIAMMEETGDISPHQDVYDYHGLAVGREFMQTAKEYNAQEAIAAYPGHLLLITGSADEMIPPLCSEQYAQAHEDQPGRTEHLSIPEGNHVFADLRHNTMAIEQIVSWFKETL
ncbi:unnamed protein product [marine sediment metagenome]|uniref:Peptidase S9 prolyl oligopeptidase catalytic domain-containing protein n=1 Tax=marine sediment metagenome TaxID=412755 RepID=X1V9E3_9ZZZZ